MTDYAHIGQFALKWDFCGKVNNIVFMHLLSTFTVQILENLLDRLNVIKVDLHKTNFFSSEKPITWPSSTSCPLSLCKILKWSLEQVCSWSAYKNLSFLGQIVPKMVHYLQTRILPDLLTAYFYFTYCLLPL